MNRQGSVDGKRAGRGIFAGFVAYFFGNTNSVFGHQKESKPSKLFKRVRRHHPHQGEKEKGRRRAQMTKGTLNFGREVIGRL